MGERRRNEGSGERREKKAQAVRVRNSRKNIFKKRKKACTIKFLRPEWILKA